MTNEKIFVTGGAGYIGSHTCVELLHHDFDVVIYDNFCNSKFNVLDRISEITGKMPELIEGDVKDREGLHHAFEKVKPAAVIHFAGLKSVAESSAQPLEYYDTNVNGTRILLDVMMQHACKNIVFSSSATVYGEPKFLPYTEDHPLAPINPYGNTKLFAEQMLRDLFHANPDWKITILRYFNPVGAHPSGLLGEDPNGIPNNLMPYITKVAKGVLDELTIFGDDFDTPDGTGVRDYLHVVDLAIGHLKALTDAPDEPYCVELNLGTGQGYSVKEVVETFERVNDLHIPRKIGPRRDGDLPSYFANSERAKQFYNWEAELSLDRMCKDSWRWEKNNMGN